MDHRFRVGKQFGLGLVGFDSQGSENPAPDSRPHDRDDAENPEIHAHNSSRDRNKMSDHGQKPGEENSTGFVTRQPMFRVFEFFRTNQHEPSVSDNQGPTDDSGDPVGEGRTQVRSDRPSQNHAGETEFALRSQKCGRRYNDFARHREDRAFHRHQHDDAGVTAVQHPAHPNLKKMMHDLISDFGFAIYGGERATSSIQKPKSAIPNRYVDLPARSAILPAVSGANSRWSRAFAHRRRIESAQTVAVQNYRRQCHSAFSLGNAHSYR